MWLSVYLGNHNDRRNSHSLDIKPDIKIKERIIRRNIYVKLDEENKHEIKYGENINDIQYVLTLQLQIIGTSQLPQKLKTYGRQH